jgi:hypothetical protein
MKTVLILKPYFLSATPSAGQNKNTPTPMQTNHKKLRYYAAVAGALLALSTSSSLAQNYLISFATNSAFATNANNGMWQWWGGATQVREFSSYDAGNDPTSGSLKLSFTWPTGSGADYQYSVGMNLSGSSNNYNGDVVISPINFTNIEFDVLWDTNSTINITNHMTGGDPNGFGMGVANGGWGQTWIPNPNEPVLINDGQWHHYNIPLNPAWSPIPGLIWKKWMGYNAANEGTTSIFYIDNVFFGTNAHPAIPRPTLKFAKATKGLTIIPSGSFQYQRNGVRSLDADTHQWYGNPDPVTYSVTIAEFPSGAKYAGFQAHMFLSTDGGTTEPDWNNANVVYVQWQQNASGAGVCNFRFKTNSPNSNGQGTGGYFGTGAIMSKTWPSIFGTWNVTFTNNSHITIVGPDGTGTNFDMGADAAAFFQSFTPSMATYFGNQPNNPDNIGQRSVFSRLKMTDGSTTVFDDSFPVADPFFEVDGNHWSVQCDSPAAAALKVVDQVAYWLDWNKPDNLLTSLQVSSNIVSGWVDSPLTIREMTARRGIYATVTNDLVGYESAAYFKLVTTNSLTP